jgi:galactonate dehydratase
LRPGPTTLLEIAALAESHRVLAPHNPLGPVAIAVNQQHLGFALPGFLLQEVMRSDVPWRDEVVVGGLPRHPYEPQPQLNTVLADGAVGDW